MQVFGVLVFHCVFLVLVPSEEQLHDISWVVDSYFLERIV